MDSSLSDLETFTYRQLQKKAKSMNLPANVKKFILIRLITMSRLGTESELKQLVNKVKRDQIASRNAKKRRQRRRLPSSSESSECSMRSWSPEKMHHPWLEDRTNGNTRNTMVEYKLNASDDNITTLTSIQPKKITKLKLIEEIVITKHDSTSEVIKFERQLSTEPKASDNFTIKNLENRTILDKNCLKNDRKKHFMGYVVENNNLNIDLSLEYEGKFGKEMFNITNKVNNMTNMDDVMKVESRVSNMDLDYPNMVASIDDYIQPISQASTTENYTDMELPYFDMPYLTSSTDTDYVFDSSVVSIQLESTGTDFSSVNEPGQEELYNIFTFNIEDGSPILLEEDISNVTPNTSSLLMIGDVDVADKLENALEFVPQNQDYQIENSNINAGIQCVFCAWSGHNMLMGEHIRKNHADKITLCTSSEWSIFFSLGSLLKDRLLLSDVLDTEVGCMYIIYVKYHEPDNFIATVFNLNSNSEDTKRSTISISNSLTKEKYTWNGIVPSLATSFFQEKADNCMKINLTKLHLLPDNINELMCRNDFDPKTFPNQVSGTVDLFNIELELTIAVT